MDGQMEESDFIGTYNFFCFFSVWVLFHVHSQIIGLQGKGEGITAESSPLHIPSSRTRTGNLWFLSASLEPLRI